MTYGMLRQYLDNLTSEQLDLDVSVYIRDTDSVYQIVDFVLEGVKRREMLISIVPGVENRFDRAEIDEVSTCLDANHPYLVSINGGIN